MRRKGLSRVTGCGHGFSHSLWNFLGDGGQNGLTALLPQWDGFHGGLHHVLCPTEGKRHQAIFKRDVLLAHTKSKNDRPSGWEVLAKFEFFSVHDVLIFQPYQQGTPHLLGLKLDLKGLSRLKRPSR